MNFIGIDISLNSTAIYIESKMGKKILSFNNKNDNNIYIRELEQNGVHIFKQERYKSNDYSENEVIKIKKYVVISKKIVDEICKHLDIEEKTYCSIEGYSFSRDTSSILDIVGLSTLIKGELLIRIENIEMSIISPKSLKLEACKLSYEPIDIGIKKPKLKYVNDQGISGGNFKKPQMMKAMIDGGFETPIKKMLIDYKHLLERDKIPNPIEDIIDSIFACIVLKNKILKK